MRAEPTRALTGLIATSAIAVMITACGPRTVADDGGAPGSATTDTQPGSGGGELHDDEGAQDETSGAGATSLPSVDAEEPVGSSAVGEDDAVAPVDAVTTGVEPTETTVPVESSSSAPEPDTSAAAEALDVVDALLASLENDLAGLAGDLAGDAGATASADEP